MSDEDGSGLELSVSVGEQGLVASGSPSAVARYQAILSEIAAKIGQKEISTGIEMAKARSSQIRPGETGQLFRFSPDSMELLRKHGAIPVGDTEFFRSMVHDGKGIAGNLDWVPVSASQAASLKSVALEMALGGVFDELADSVRRIESSVLDVRDLVQAAGVGRSFGLSETLQPLARRVQSGGELSTTEWEGIQAVEREVLAGREEIRFYLQSKIDAAEPGWSASSRAGAAQELVDANLQLSLDLLMQHNHSLVAWHYLRLERVARFEPEHLTTIERDSQNKLEEAIEKDRALLDDLAEPTGWEGLEILDRKKLLASIGIIDEAIVNFADARYLDVSGVGDASLPGLRDSIRRAGSNARSAVGWTGTKATGVAGTGRDAARSVGKRIPKPKLRRDRRPELPSAGED